MSRAQLRDVASDTTVARWVDEGYLHRLLPHVYAVGHPARTIEADLAAALLYAAPGAALSHASALWWLGLLEERGHTIHVTTSRRCRSLPGIRVHDRRNRTRVLHRGLATNTLAEALVDFAPAAPLRAIRKVLANAEYQNVLNVSAVEQAIRVSRSNATKVRIALEEHQPRLALTDSDLEVLLIEICEEEHIPLPELRVYVNGWRVDALWRDAKLAVELDGHGNHHTPAQLRRDRRKEMALREADLTPIRYSADQLKNEREPVVAELRQLTRRA